MNLKPDDLPLYLAIWGATLSTVLGIFEVIKFAQNLLQNKRRLRVSFHPEISASPQGEPRMYIKKLQDGEPYSFFVDYTLAHKSAEDFKEVFIQDAEGKRYTSKIPKAFKKNSS